MLLKNEWTFGGEIVRKTDFGTGKGGNIVVKGASDNGDVELSIAVSESMFMDIFDKKYPKVIVSGHIEQRTWETSGHNIKHSLRYIADNLELVS